MARRKQLKVSMSNIALKGWKNQGVESEFQHLGDKGVGIYFLLLQRMGGQNITWISTNIILEQLGLQRRDKKKVVSTLNYLMDLKLMFGHEVLDDVNSNTELQFEMETDLKSHSYTTFYPNNFDLYKMLGSKCFSIFCLLDSFIGTNKSAWCSVDTLVEITSFSNNTILQYIFIMSELGIYDVTRGVYNPATNKNTHNTYTSCSKGRIKLLQRDVEEVKQEVATLRGFYNEANSTTDDNQSNTRQIEQLSPFDNPTFIDVYDERDEDDVDEMLEQMDSMSMIDMDMLFEDSIKNPKEIY